MPSIKATYTSLSNSTSDFLFNTMHYLGKLISLYPFHISNKIGQTTLATIYYSLEIPQSDSFCGRRQHQKMIHLLSNILAKNLLSPCPYYICKSLNPSNPYLQVWLDSYHKEEQGLIDHNVYEKVSESHYFFLKRSGNILKSIPSMCVLFVKNDKNVNPLTAKSA